MKLWFKKLSVVLITFMTFGIFIPPTYLDGETAEHEVIISTSENNLAEINTGDLEQVDENNGDTHQQFATYAIEQAKYQTLHKFGPKISNKIGDEFLNEIMPKIEDVILNLTENCNVHEVQSFVISEKPAAGYGEKIFHIYNEITNEDVARFHVRRVNHPREGHSFNFHYHLFSDQFVKHYELGDIYWDRNTPPKWMS